MKKENGIPITTLCDHYKLEKTFFDRLFELKLIEINTINSIQYIAIEVVHKMDKMVRMHQELEINLEGIDVVFNLIEKIANLQNELIALKNRLQIYENHQF